MSGDAKRPRPAHVIVLGNEKGGSGKSTTALHIAVALMAEGARVATLDLDARQGTLSRYVENRAAYARRKAVELSMPQHAAGMRLAIVVSRWNDHYTSRLEAGAREASANAQVTTYVVPGAFELPLAAKAAAQISLPRKPLAKVRWGLDLSHSARREARKQ